MAEGTFCSHTDKTSEDGVRLKAGNSGSDWHYEQSDNFDEQFEAAQTKMRQHSLIEVSKVTTKGNLDINLNDIHNPVTNLIDSNKKLTENRTQQDRTIASYLKSQEDFRKEIKIDIESSLKKSAEELQRQKKEFLDRLQAETCDCTGLISRVKYETEAKFKTVNKNIISVSKDLETKLEQDNAQTNLLIGELTDGLITNRSEVGTKIEKLDFKLENVDIEVQQVKDELREMKEQMIKQQREIAELMSQKTTEKLQAERQMELLRLEIKTLKGRYLKNVSKSLIATGIVEQNDQDDEALAHTCQGQSISCKEGERKVAKGNNVAVTVGNPSVWNFLRESEFPLPLFDDNSDVNPVFHMRKLDDYINLRGIPAASQLAAAYRSLIGSRSRQWADTMRHQISDYGSFRKAFLNTWWSASQQRLVKRRLYKGKYSRQSNLSLSQHFLKYAAMASNLDPRPTDFEIIEAIRYHFPVSVQRVMLNPQLNSIEETLDLLRRVEILEKQEMNNTS
jgi:hypothetical protein